MYIKLGLTTKVSKTLRLSTGSVNPHQTRRMKNTGASTAARVSRRTCDWRGSVPAADAKKQKMQVWTHSELPYRLSLPEGLPVWAHCMVVKSELCWMYCYCFPSVANTRGLKTKWTRWNGRQSRVSVSVRQPSFIEMTLKHGITESRSKRNLSYYYHCLYCLQYPDSRGQKAKTKNNTGMVTVEMEVSCIKRASFHLWFIALGSKDPER